MSAPRLRVATAADARAYDAAERRAIEGAYRVWTPPEIWAPIDPPVYAIATLTRGDVAMFCAHGSSLKSWAAIDAVISKASGEPWLDRFACDAAPALYLDAEMGSDECRRRMQRAALAHGLRAPVEGVALVSMPPFRLSTPEGLAELHRLACDRTLVAIDSLAAFLPDVDENDARFADPLKRMKAIGDETGCAFLLLHHSRKAKEGDDERERPRGTSALFAACDAVFQLGRVDEGAFLVRQTKARKGKAADPFVLRVQDLDGADATRVYATALDVARDAVTTNTDALGTAKAAVLALLAHDHDVRSANEANRRLKGHQRKQVLAAVKEHMERGLVVEHEGSLRLASEVQR